VDLHPHAGKSRSLSKRLQLSGAVTEPDRDVMTGSVLTPFVHKDVHWLGDANPAVGIPDIENFATDSLGGRVNQFERGASRELGQIEQGHRAIGNFEVDAESVSRFTVMNRQMLNESGQLSWTTPAGTRDLRDYAHFAGPKT